MSTKVKFEIEFPYKLHHNYYTIIFLHPRGYPNGLQIMLIQEGSCLLLFGTTLKNKQN